MKKNLNLKSAFLVLFLLCIQIVMAQPVGVWEKIGGVPEALNATHAAIDSKGNLYVASNTKISCWDRTKWITMGTLDGNPDNRIEQMIIGEGDKVHICGRFSKINSSKVSHIAQSTLEFVDKSWYEPYSGSSQNSDMQIALARVIPGHEKKDIDITAIAFNDGKLRFITSGFLCGYKVDTRRNVDSKFNLLQNFTRFNEDNYNAGIYHLQKNNKNELFASDHEKIMKLNGNKWEQLGGVFNEQMPNFLIDNAGTIYTYGKSTKVGNTVIDYVGKWNGTQWVNVGGLLLVEPNSINPGCHALAMDKQNKLYAGIYADPGKSPIYELNGTKWQALGVGLDVTEQECLVLTSDPARNYLYAVCSKGVYRLNTNTTPQVATAPVLASTLTPRTFNGTPNTTAELPLAVTQGINSQSAVTIEYWFKGTKIQSAFRLQNGGSYIVAGYKEQEPVHFFSNEGQNNQLPIKTKTGGSVQDNQWHHIAVTWAKGAYNGFVSYVDGELIQAKNAGIYPLPAFGNIKPVLGAYVVGASKTELTNGQIARLRVWKTARTADEIKANRDKDLPANTPNMLYQGNGN
jgi:Concanavalin A-like lectin/glucanases superfamily